MPVARALTAVLSAIVLMASAASADASASLPGMTSPVTVVPSAGLPPQVKVNRSNANLSVARSVLRAAGLQPGRLPARRRDGDPRACPRALDDAPPHPQ